MLHAPPFYTLQLSWWAGIITLPLREIYSTRAEGEKWGHSELNRSWENIKGSVSLCQIHDTDDPVHRLLEGNMPSGTTWKKKFKSQRLDSEQLHEEKVKASNKPTWDSGSSSFHPRRYRASCVSLVTPTPCLGKANCPICSSVSVMVLRETRAYAVRYNPR